MTFARLAALLLVLAACGADPPTPAGARKPDSSVADASVPIVADGPPQPRVSTPVPAPVDAPPARACKTHDECVVVPTMPAADACCDVTVTAAGVTRAYLQFMEKWRSSSCSASHVCASNDLPGAQMAPACYIGRCVAGMCDLACSDPAFDPSTAPGLP